MKCTINRRSQFSASHRYWLEDLSYDQNQQLFGKCIRSKGHGHNYELHVSIESELDDYGMVLNLSKAKDIIHREVVEPLDFSFLNDTWDEFKTTLPTTEHMARVIWQRLSPHLPITNIKLFETPELWADYTDNGQGNGMEAYLTVSAHFSAAHVLALPHLSYEENCEIYGKCARPNGHGHNYTLEVTVRGNIDERTGMIVDLVALKDAITQHVIDPFDHTFLNKDITYFASVVPTAENIVIHIHDLLKQPIQSLDVSLHKVKLSESPNNSAEVLASSLDQQINQQAQQNGRTVDLPLEVKSLAAV